MLSRLFGCLLFLLLAGGIGRAQKTSPPTQPKIPVAPVAITPTATVPATPLPAPGQDMVRMQYPNTDVKDILAVYERLTGKKIVFDNTVQGPVNIVISREVPREEAIKIIEINLLLNGFAFVPDENNIVKVTGIGRNPRSTGVPVYSDIDQLPEGDRVVSFLFKLKYADPVELQTTLGTYIAPAPTGYTSMVALPKAQSLLVTENTAVLRSLIKIIGQIDVAPADVVTEFIQLERADAKEVLEKLEKIFEKSPSGSTTTTVTRSAPPPPVPGQPPSINVGATSVDINTGGPSEESLIIGRIKLSADVRTNRILVVTRPTNLPFIKKLIKEFDSDIKFAEPKIRSLKYVLAGDVLPVIVKAITEPGMKTEEPTGQGGTGAQGQRTGNTTGAAGGFGAGGGGRNGSNAGGLGGSSSGSSLSLSEELQTQPTETTPQAVTIGTTKIIADRRANTIIVLGNEDVTNKVFKVLDEMDVRAPQVVLNTVIGELRLSKDEEFGVDILKFLKLYSGSSIGTSGTGSTTGGTTTGDPLSGLTNAAGFLAARGISAAATGGLSQYAIATKNFAGTVKALEATGRFRITQRPMVFASNNKKAIIASGEEIAVPGQTLSSLNNGNGFNQNASVASTVQFRQVALQLEVVPLINSDREVSLDILQKIDDLSGQNDVVGGNSIPRINTRYIRTNVSIANGETVVLGGLIKKRNERSTSGPTLISRVPLVGYFFRTTNKTEERSELIILIRPVVTIKPKETLDASEREQERLFIPPDLESTLDPPNSRIKTGRPATVKPVAPKPALRFGK